jgi:hypothetical protein
MFGTSSVLLFKVAYCCFGMAQSIAICLPKKKKLISYYQI